VVWAILQYFCSVFTKEDVDSVPVGTNNTAPTVGINDIEITEDMVKKKLSALRQDKAGGADNLLPRLLMQIQNEISHPLWILFQKSLQEGAVPEDWKRANVTPIFKKGSRGLPENYRPVSLTSQCSKLFEAIVRDSLTEYLESNCTITDSQHGFRTGRSCMSNLLSFLDRVSEGVDAGKVIDVIYLDFAKALDKVPHQILLHKNLRDIVLVENCYSG